MSLWAKVRQLFGQEDQAASQEEDGENLERQPKWSEQSQTSSNLLELPRESHKGRRNESSSLKAAPTTRKPRPVHRSATDTMRGSGTDTEDRRPGYNTSVIESNSEEESSTAKLARRPSVLVSYFKILRKFKFQNLDRFDCIVSAFEQFWPQTTFKTYAPVARWKVSCILVRYQISTSKKNDFWLWRFKFFMTHK